MSAQPITAADIPFASNGRGQPNDDDHGLVTVRLCDVKSEPVRFIWPGRIARRKLNLLVGDPGLGKSTIALDVIARLTRGAPWPDGGIAPASDALVLSAEDDLSDTVRPRLDALGADPTRVHAVTAVRSGEGGRQFSLTADLSRLDGFLRQYPQIGLVVIDPLSAYLGSGTDSYKDADVRAILAPLAALAGERDVAVLGIMHLGKGGQRPALYRVLGSIAFTAAARLVLAVAEHPEKDGRRVLAPVKQNICAPSPTLAFRLDDGRLTWEGVVEGGVDLDAVLGSGAPDHQERRDAVDWLRELLADGDMPARDIRRAATDSGMGWRSVETAKAKLRVQARLVGFGTSGRWHWHLPTTDPASSLTSAVSAVSEEDPYGSPEAAQRPQRPHEGEGKADAWRLP